MVSDIFMANYLSITQSALIICQYVLFSTALISEFEREEKADKRYFTNYVFFCLFTVVTALLLNYLRNFKQIIIVQ